MTEAVLYRWPAAARFGRVVPKTKFYEHGRVTAAGRERFVAEVQRITWAYKLADATIHLRGNAEVPEIQVFVIDAKGDDVSDLVLTAIDRSVPFPIIFELNRARDDGRETRVVATYKNVTAASPKVGPYLSTQWLEADAGRVPMPAALDLAGLYAALLSPLLPVMPRQGESMAVSMGRVERAAKLQRDLSALERRMGSEPQLNRKIELRRQINRLAEDLAELVEPQRPTAEATLGKED